MEERNISWMCARRDTYRMVSLYLLSSVRHLFPSVIHPNLTHAQINKRYSRSIGRRLATVVQRPIKMQLDNVENKYRIETMKKTVSWLNGKWKMRQTCPIIRNGIWCVDFDFDGVQILHLIQQQCTLATVVISHMQRHSHSLRAQPALSPPIQFFFHVLIAHPNDRFFITNITSMVRHDDFDGNSFTTQITNSQPIFRSIPSQSNYNHMEFQFQTCTKCLLGDIEVTMHLQASEDLSNNKKTHSQHFMQTMWSVPSPTLPLNLSSHFRCITFFFRSAVLCVIRKQWWYSGLRRQSEWVSQIFSIADKVSVNRNVWEWSVYCPRQSVANKSVFRERCVSVVASANAAM